MTGRKTTTATKDGDDEAPLWADSLIQQVSELTDKVKTLEGGTQSDPPQPDPVSRETQGNGSSLEGMIGGLVGLVNSLTEKVNYYEQRERERDDSSNGQTSPKKSKTKTRQRDDDGDDEDDDSGDDDGGKAKTQTGGFLSRKIF